MKHFYKDIPGMMDYEDLYSEMVERFPSYSTFVELGFWHGRSAAYMCTEIVNSGKVYMDVLSVDNFLKSPISNAQELQSKFNFFNAIKSDTASAAELFKDESLEFVFIDADHSAKGVTRDIEAWLPKVKKGGVLAGHDYGNWRYPELKIAVDKILSEAKKTSEMCWIYEK